MELKRSKFKLKLGPIKVWKWNLSSEDHHTCPTTEKSQIIEDSLEQIQNKKKSIKLSRISPLVPTIGMDKKSSQEDEEESSSESVRTQRKVMNDSIMENSSYSGVTPSPAAKYSQLRIPAPPSPKKKPGFFRRAFNNTAGSLLQKRVDNQVQKIKQQEMAEERYKRHRMSLDASFFPFAFANDSVLGPNTSPTEKKKPEELSDIDIEAIDFEPKIPYEESIAPRYISDHSSIFSNRFFYKFYRFLIALSYIFVYIYIPLKFSMGSKSNVYTKSMICTHHVVVVIDILVLLKYGFWEGENYSNVLAKNKNRICQ